MSSFESSETMAGSVNRASCERRCKGWTSGVPSFSSASTFCFKTSTRPRSGSLVSSSSLGVGAMVFSWLGQRVEPTCAFGSAGKLLQGVERSRFLAKRRLNLCVRPGDAPKSFGHLRERRARGSRVAQRSKEGGMKFVAQSAAGGGPDHVGASHDLSDHD